MECNYPITSDQWILWVWCCTNESNLGLSLLDCLSTYVLFLYHMPLCVPRWWAQDTHSFMFQQICCPLAEHHILVNDQLETEFSILPQALGMRDRCRWGEKKISLVSSVIFYSHINQAYVWTWRSQDGVHFTSRALTIQVPLVCACIK